MPLTHGLPQKCISISDIAHWQSNNRIHEGWKIGVGSAPRGLTTQERSPKDRMGVASVENSLPHRLETISWLCSNSRPYWTNASNDLMRMKVSSRIWKGRMAAKIWTGNCLQERQQISYVYVKILLQRSIRIFAKWGRGSSWVTVYFVWSSYLKVQMV